MCLISLFAIGYWSLAYLTCLVGFCLLFCCLAYLLDEPSFLLYLFSRMPRMDGSLNCARALVVGKGHA